MARTHKTAHIKQQMAEEALREEEARAAAVVRDEAAAEDTLHRVNIENARTRSEKAVVIQRTRESRAETATPLFGPHGVGQDDQEVDELEGDGDEGQADDDDEAGDNEGGTASQPEAVQKGEEKTEQEVTANRRSNVAMSDKPSPRQGKKRSVADVDADLLVSVPPFEEEHTTWAAFEQGLKMYMRATRQVLAVKEVISVARRNSALKNQLQYKDLPEEEIPLVPEDMG
ncbi:hypothetical protein PInf_010277 [Phytophthora infestans]|nr:hypothetical protein PInf_010277 [Phytophthora infestans]